MDPVTALALASGTAGAIWGGDGQPDPKHAGDVHLANAGQLELYNAMLKRYMAGAGDFGMGQNVKTGNSQLQQFMGDRGISPQSGYSGALFANMLGTSGANASQTRDAFGMNLLRSPLQTVQTSGSNWLPTSPSFGYSESEQWKHFADAKKRYAGKFGPTFSDWKPYNY